MEKDDLSEPLLCQSEKEPDIEDGEARTEEIRSDKDDNKALLPNTQSSTTTSDADGNNNNGTNDNISSSNEFSIREEIAEFAALGIPLAISFFCRMGMASTDSAFVGHIRNEIHTPETYLAAAVLSDMVIGICTAPPLAFNQVLNALVGQAMGSGNPKMAGIWLQQSMFWLSVTMLPCLTGLFFVEPILRLLQFPDNIAAVAGTYAKYNIIWPIPNGLYQCMRFYFQAQGMPRPAMYNNIAFLFVNAFLNWIFVFGGPFRYMQSTGHWNGLGFIGAAISLSISRTMQSIVYFLYMFVYKQYHKPTWPEDGWSFSNHTPARTKEFMKQSVPNIGTILFQSAVSQATTVIVGQLGELPIAASSALSTVSIPWSGTLSATTCTISGVRVGYHLGRGDAYAAKQSAWMVQYFITAVCALVAVLFLPLKRQILMVSTDDEGILGLAASLVPALLVGTYLNLLVSNITSGVFSGMGRPLIATILSFGLELPLSIGGVAVYIFYYHGDLLGVYWLQAITGGVELAIVLAIFIASDWDKCADDARRRQESPSTLSSEDEEANEVSNQTTQCRVSENQEENSEQERLITSDENLKRD